MLADTATGRGAVNEISVVIPVREGGSPEITLQSLGRQTFRDFNVVVSWDKAANANSARNRGAELATAPYLLFSDDDIQWEPDALEHLRNALLTHADASYSYGAYAIGGWIQCHREFDAGRLRRANFISTMSLIRRETFPGFDESIERLQDWDLWLTMLERGSVGVYCGKTIFRTEKGHGISYGSGAPPYDDAVAIVKRKHGLA